MFDASLLSNNPLGSLIMIAYYIIVGLIALTGFFGVYLLLIHGRSRTFSLIFSALYILFFFILTVTSYTTLTSAF